MFKIAIAALSLALLQIATAVPLRVATFNIGAVYSGNNAIYSLGDPGTPDHEKVKEVLARIDADVVALEEIDGADVPGDLNALAQSLGYPYQYVASVSGAFDTSLRNAVLSRYPLLSTNLIGSPAGAKEIARFHVVVKVDVPETTNDPTLVVVHLKSSDASEDRFRRAVEMKRLVDYMQARGLTNNDRYIVLGDFNPSGTDRDYTSLPSGLPATYDLGDDIPLSAATPVRYRVDPTFYFNGSTLSPVRLDPRQTNGSRATYNTNGNSQSAIDLLLISPALAQLPNASEIYNSALDRSNTTGLPKAGNPPASDATVLASDHYAVFADLELDGNYPPLALTTTGGPVAENAPAGTAKLSVSLPSPAAAAVTVNFSSSDPSAAEPAAASIVIPAGASTGTVDITTTRNFLDDSGTTVTFRAYATGYNAATSQLLVLDTEEPYRFTAAGQTITEDFTSFKGTHDPAPWTTSMPTAWMGADDGGSNVAGLRAYGPAGNPSLGILPDALPVTFSTSYRNDSTTVLDSVEVSFNARQWRAVLNGTSDHLKVDVITPGGTIPVPALGYSPSSTLPTGAIASPPAVPRSAIVNGLAIQPGQSFQIRFTVTPGTSGASLFSGAFVNEFHYDNVGDDTGEFIEVVVGPGYTGSLSALQLVLYNGNGGATYGTHALSTFTLGSTTPSGHKIYHKMIAGIQNDTDGFALVNGSGVLEFLSYEGTFTATNGPAAGRLSVDVGVAQNSSTPVGTNSIRLAGSGEKAADFAWTKSDVPHSPGGVNDEQSFVSAAQTQGISVDDVSVRFIGVDPDLDSDADGYTDLVEVNLLLTDPYNSASKFSPSMSSSMPGTMRLSFPTLAGRKYLVQSSTDLRIWDEGTSYPGDGGPLNLLYFTEGMPDRFYRVTVSYE